MRPDVIVTDELFGRDDVAIVREAIGCGIGVIASAHAADARAAPISLHDSFNLTADHKPSNPSEKERVELLGGRIINYGVLRVQGVLAVTRALGDFSLRPFVSNVPTVSCFALQGDECFVVLASDGLW